MPSSITAPARGRNAATAPSTLATTVTTTAITAAVNSSPHPP